MLLIRMLCRADSLVSSLWAWAARFVQLRCEDHVLHTEALSSRKSWSAANEALHFSIFFLHLYRFPACDDSPEACIAIDTRPA
jgi:hypothetical protein